MGQKLYREGRQGRQGFNNQNQGCSLYILFTFASLAVKLFPFAIRHA
jgi:hypothetical protein